MFVQSGVGKLLQLWVVEFSVTCYKICGTGKSVLEALILASANPQYNKRLFIDLPVQYMKTISSEHVVYINFFECQNKTKQKIMCTTCSELVVFMYWTGKLMNNLLSYCGLVDARKSAPEKDLPVLIVFFCNNYFCL